LTGNYLQLFTSPLPRFARPRARKVEVQTPHALALAHVQRPLP